MAKQTNNSKQGFTIIEVVLVLAIAGLIFIMVFIALPALQRSQRDTSRRNDMSRVDTSLVQYQTNNSSSSNNLPNKNGTSAVTWTGAANFGDVSSCNEACAFIRDYMNTGSSEKDKDNEFLDPDGKPYSLVITTNWGGKSTGNITNAKLGTSQLSKDGTNERYTITDNGGNSYDAHVVYIVPGGRCDNQYVVPSQTRHFAVLYRLEGAGVYCIDDQ